MAEPRVEWDACLGLLERTSGLFRSLNRSAIRLDPDWPEEEFQGTKDALDDYVYPDSGPPPFERLAAIEAEFVLDRDENPHPRLLALALAARRRSCVLGSGNLAAQSYYLGILHACVEATGCEESEIVGWLDAHDTLPRPSAVIPRILSDEAIDLAVRIRRIARGAPGEALLYRHWQGILDLLCVILGSRPDEVDAFIAYADPLPADALPEPRSGQPVALRRRP
jgi:hypothetical protein